MLSVISFGLGSIGAVYANNNSNDNLYNGVWCDQISANGDYITVNTTKIEQYRHDSDIAQSK